MKQQECASTSMRPRNGLRVRRAVARFARFAAAAVLLWSLGSSVWGQTQRRVEHVILITIDGMRGDYLGHADRYGLKVPTLRSLMRDGSYSERAISVFPTLTGPSHASLVTGTGAGKHEILGNNQFDPSVWAWDKDSYDAQPPYRAYSQIKTGTLWSAARTKGLKTAAIAWPQTAGGPIDYILNIGSIGSPQAARAPWMEAVEAKIGSLVAADARMSDHLRALGAAEILRQFRPSLMAVHFTLTDAVQHEMGPGTPAALVAMEEADGNVAILLNAIRDLQLGDRTTVIVTGDHGHLNLHTQLAINLPLVEAGLIERDAKGLVSWKAIIAPNRGLGSLYVTDPADTNLISKARQALETYAKRYPRRFRILERLELDEQRADRRAILGIEPEVGYVLDARLRPPFAEAHDRASGHGYRPETPGMETALIISGAGVRRGVSMPSTSAIDVAPTIALLLGLELPDAEGQPIVGALEH